MALILVTINNKPVAEIPLEKKEITIGRDPQNDIHLKNPSVSRVHAKIVKKGAPFYIEDMNSTNGTFVNDHKIEWRTGLNNNDKITVGKYTLVFLEQKKGRGKKTQPFMPDFIDSTVKFSKKK